MDVINDKAKDYFAELSRFLMPEKPSAQDVQRLLGQTRETLRMSRQKREGAPRSKQSKPAPSNVMSDSDKRMAHGRALMATLRAEEKQRHVLVSESLERTRAGLRGYFAQRLGKGLR